MLYVCPDLALTLPHECPIDALAQAKWLCYIYNGQSERENKNPNELSISFAKVNKVNEASAFDQISDQEPGAFLLPKIGSEDDDLCFLKNMKERGKGK